MTMIKRSTLILLLVLSCLALLATAYYLFPTASLPNTYILNLRLKKLGIREFLRPHAISFFSYLLAMVTGSSTEVND